ncbi:hypothetical protein LY90DRAFT_502892 [Neocallimastix californiae]|uniref:TLDc domain-containing protein n=1 Tax=Neocallimastix californiae TaxID=1754190 RepID=A0A1Y2EQ96_9FUNG|nr:hypothetical protein LY90DRAFT_502892 [Neocallimastix californiae]|eukprot:ORY73707.1 hypothetical protein LY90DRAFT_502892 [Neocallimastix californiae]
MRSKNNEETSIALYEIEEESIFVLKYSEKNYEIKLQLVKINKESFIRIIAQEEKKIVNYNYQIDMNKEDFIKQDNILLRPYREIQEIYNFITESFNENIVSINDIKEKISFNLMIKGKIIGYKKPLTFIINLKKENCGQDDKEEMLCRRINELEKENNNLKVKVNSLEEKENKLELKFKKLEEEIQKLILYNEKNKLNEIIQSEEELRFIKNRLLKIPGRKNSNVNLELIYKMTEDGDSIETFHSKCDNIPNNLVLIKSSSGARFGGYTDKPWYSISSVGVHVEDNNCFCFSLSKNKIYDAIKNKNSIYNSIYWGPFFCNLFGIGGPNNFLSSGGCYDYSKSNSYFSGVNTPYEINNGYSEFKVLEFELYHVVFE